MLRTLLLLGTGAVGLGVCASALVEAALTEAPHATRRPPSHPKPRALDAPTVERLFALRSTPPTPSRPSRSPFAGKLIGTLANARGDGLASLLIDGKVRTIAERDVVLDAEVMAIERGAVVLRRDGQLEVLRADGPTSAQLQRPVAADAPRREIERALAELGTAAQLVPAFKDGRVAGFRFATLAPASQLAALGLRRGDIVRAINGLSVADSRSLAQFITGLGDTASLELERDGQVVTLAVALR